MYKVTIKSFDANTRKLTTDYSNTWVATLHELLDRRDLYMVERGYTFKQCKVDFYSYLMYNSQGDYIGVYSIVPEGGYYGAQY